MELKYIIFFTILLIGVPAATILAYSSRKIEKMAWIIMISFGFLGDHASINFFSYEWYRGTSRGMEVTLVDLFTLVIFFLMLLKRGFKIKLIIPGIFFYLLYFLLSILSVMNAENAFYSFTELWKMGRVFFFFIVAYNYIDWRRDFSTIFYSFAIVAYITLFQVLNQKYRQGVYQPRGFFPHQNSMALYMELLGPVFLALWMNVKLKTYQSVWFITGFFCISASCILSFSRASFLFYPAACFLCMFFTILLHYQFRQLKIIVLLGVIGILGVSAMLPGMLRRIEHAPESSKISRINLAIAARNMANDKIFGVGINNWGIKINPPYTYSEHRTGGRYTEDFKDGLVETIYMMVAAECGWIGLGSLILLFLYYWFSLLRLIFSYAKAPLFFLPVGIFSGLTAIYIHSILEWVLKQSPNFYQLMFFFALTSVLITWHKDKSSDAKYTPFFQS